MGFVTSFGTHQPMDVKVMKDQIRILEQLETVADWIIGMGRGKDKEDMVVSRYLRGTLRLKYKRILRQGHRNVGGGLDRRVVKLRSYGEYEAKSREEVREFFGKSSLYGDGLELWDVFSKHERIHRCSTYGEFLRRIHKFDVDKTGFEYLEYLDDVRRYLWSFSRIKYPRRLRKLKISRRSVLEKIGSRRFVEMEESMERRGDVDGCPKVYCISCRMEISRNVFKFHVDGRRHVRNKERGEDSVLCFCRSVGEVEEEIRRMVRMLEKERRHSIRLVSTGRKRQECRDIPQWLFKKKELDIMFSCEVCGYEGHGRESFDLHFTGDEHVGALRLHGVEDNMGMARGITRVDILMKIKERLDGMEREPFEEEFEDDEGNVFDKRTYEDLRRNGLV